MCAIQGFKDVVVNKDFVSKVIENMNQMWYRGEDSFGAMLIRDSCVKVIKCLEIDDFERKLMGEKGESYDWVIVHQRKASVGSVCLDLCHPIRKGNVFVVHNGTKRDIKFGYASDTQAIADILRYRNESFVKRNLECLLRGVGVVIGYDSSKGKFLFWKDETRPLVRKDKFFVSEPIDFLSKFGVVKDTRKLVEKKNLFNALKVKSRIKLDLTYIPNICSCCRRYMLCKTEYDYDDFDKYKEYLMGYKYYYYDVGKNVCWECSMKEGDKKC